MALIASDPTLPAMVPQGTASWTRARIGMLTGSRMAEAMSYLKKGGDSADRRNLKFEVLAERLTDVAADHYVSPAMMWGLEHEGEAKLAYREATGNEIKPAGFILHPSIEFFGATPDGLIDHDGTFEAKCPTTQTHITWMMNGVVPEEYKPQMVAEIVCSRRKWCDFASYDPRMPAHRRLFVRRFVPTAEEIQKVEDEARKFLAEVSAMFDMMNS